ncbi:hypothetical protein F2P81_014316 [Scophthalmus maximus]|uniref:Sin3 histone deacetylase corepressor complex component SDS3 n=1 Tax=Scophthalmus maximus TaxID=52904 RepID=A0A6A4SQR8_SCOMX|nr:hypothetical protein F2P81_014316 [Scophthalmus maximus]
MVDYYNDEEELDSVEDDDDRSFRGRDSEEDTEDASETDLAKHDEDDYVEIKEQMYQDKLASLKRQLQQLQEGTLQEYQKRMKKLDQQYKERLRNADLFLQLETEQVERNYIKEKKAAVKEFDDKKVELKENLIAELEEKKKMIENEKLTMELTGDDQIMEDLRTLNKLKSPKRPVSPSSPEHVPSAPMDSPSQRYEARIEEGKLYYDKRWYHKSQAIYLESKDNTKISCVISSVGTNEVDWEKAVLNVCTQQSLQRQLHWTASFVFLNDNSLSVLSPDLGEEDERQHKDEDLPGAAAERGLRHPSAVGRVKHSPTRSICPFVRLHRFTYLVHLR